MIFATPTFPIAASDKVKLKSKTLRDYFAAKALSAMISGAPLTASENPKLTARGAYQFADAMMEARDE